MTRRRRSLTPPSPRRARHRGPTRGSCSTRIGVTARSGGTTTTPPAPAQPHAFQHPDGAMFNCRKGGEMRGRERYHRWRSARGGGGEDAEALAAATRADRAAAEIGVVGLPREGRGRGVYGFGSRGAGVEGRVRGLPAAIGGRIRAWPRRQLLP
ncbi:hypothetical protein PVAP13_7KG208755 [Panicum virgatum]|uniref:Uncharacterized protein n=1 Tax=Panicum virgatum TaxID=38727 RepID=A0A8T0QJD0_PANVG|nr:hypothetical protein PVAP13_7KG208755 [Panicum virgatum]